MHTPQGLAARGIVPSRYEANTPATDSHRNTSPSSRLMPAVSALHRSRAASTSFWSMLRGFSVICTASAASARSRPSPSGRRGGRVASSWRISTSARVAVGLAVSSACLSRSRAASPTVSPSISAGDLPMQEDIEEGAVNVQAAVVLDEAELPELVHESADPRPGGADHLGQHFLADLRNHRLGGPFLAEASQ